MKVNCVQGVDPEEYFSEEGDFTNITFGTQVLPADANPDYFPEDYFVDRPVPGPIASFLDESDRFGEITEEDYIDIPAATFLGSSDEWLLQLRTVRTPPTSLLQ